MKHRLGGRLKHIARHLTPTTVLNSHASGRIFREFADRIGLVYFGYVNQKDDEHRLIRGITLSPTVRDSHYCIGSYNKYDVMMAQRQDTIREAGQGRGYQEFAWLVMVIDLHVEVDLPRVFIVPKTFSNILTAEMLSLHSHTIALPMGNLGQYNEAFARNFVVYGHAASALQIRDILQAEVMQHIAAEMERMAIEIFENSVYIYADVRPSRQLLEKMLKSGITFANMIDKYLGVEIVID